MEVVGPVISVDFRTRQLVVRGTGPDQGLHYFSVPNATPVSINGVADWFENIGVGDHVSVSYTMHRYVPARSAPYGLAPQHHTHNGQELANWIIVTH